MRATCKNIHTIDFDIMTCFIQSCLNYCLCVCVRRNVKLHSIDHRFARAIMLDFTVIHGPRKIHANDRPGCTLHLARWPCYRAVSIQDSEFASSPMPFSRQSRRTSRGDIFLLPRKARQRRGKIPSSTTLLSLSAPPPSFPSAPAGPSSTMPDTPSWGRAARSPVPPSPAVRA